MKKSRKRAAILSVAIIMSLSVASPAHADTRDAAEGWAAYLCSQLGFCSEETPAADAPTEEPYSQ